MSKQLPPPGRAGDLTALLRSRHAGATAPVPQQPAEVVAVADPFAPVVLDPATVTGNAEEKLAAFEAAMESAHATADRSLKAARAKFVVEAGFALKEIRDQDGGLYKAAGHETFEGYVKTRWDMDRTRAYQLMDAAPVMLVMAKIFDAPPVESQARVLGPVLKDHGEQAVSEVVVSVQQSGDKPTAVRLRDSALRLNYLTRVTEQVESEPAEAPRGDTPDQARALARLEQGLSALRAAHKALRGTVVGDAVAADEQRGGELAAQVRDLARKIERLGTWKKG